MIQSTTPQRQVVAPGPDGQRFVTADGELRHVPAGWVRVAPSDPRAERLLAAGPAWCVALAFGRSRFTTDLWVPPERLEPKVSPGDLDAIRSKVVELLDFAPRHRALAEDLARAVAGAGSEFSPDRGRSLDQSALQGAVMAWLGRHLESEDQQRPASRSGRDRLRDRVDAILNEYRIGLPRQTQHCPLARALDRAGERS